MTFIPIARPRHVVAETIPRLLSLLASTENLHSGGRNLAA